MLILSILLGLAACAALYATVGDRGNFEGDLSVTVPTGGYVRGSVYALQNIHVVARETKSAADTAVVAARGAVWAKKTSGQAWAVGQKLYFVTATNALSTAATGNTLIGGFVLQAAASADVLGFVQIDSPSPALT